MPLTSKYPTTSKVPSLPIKKQSPQTSQTFQAFPRKPGGLALVSSYAVNAVGCRKMRDVRIESDIATLGSN